VAAQVLATTVEHDADGDLQLSGEIDGQSVAFDVSVA
jgi:hypothetical protein